MSYQTSLIIPETVETVGFTDSLRRNPFPSSGGEKTKGTRPRSLYFPSKCDIDWTTFLSITSEGVINTRVVYAHLRGDWE
jgi:hypothetical protein